MLVLLLTGLLAANSGPAVDTSHVHEAEAFVRAAFGSECDMNDRNDIPVNATDPDEVSHFVYDVSYRNSSEPDQPPHATMLYQMFCSMGAYNMRSVFLLRDADSDAFQLLAFPYPNVDYSYLGNGDTKLEAPPKVTGYVAETYLVNATYNPDTQTITSHALWRGLGDAWDGGEWKMVDGAFVLTRYMVDPTYDFDGDKPAKPDAAYVVVGH